MNQPVWFSFAQPLFNQAADPFTGLPLSSFYASQGNQKEFSRSSKVVQTVKFSELIFTAYVSSLFSGELFSLIFSSFQLELKFPQTFTGQLWSNSILLHKLTGLHNTTSFSLSPPFFLISGPKCTRLRKSTRNICSRHT